MLSNARNHGYQVKKTPEEIEREIKAQEAELQKLLQVHLKLPSTALWFEPPTIVRWDEEKCYWTSAGFYGISFNEGKQTLSFKTMHFGIFGLSAFRFSNLPFQVRLQDNFLTVNNINQQKHVKSAAKKLMRKVFSIEQLISLY